MHVITNGHKNQFGDVLIPQTVMKLAGISQWHQRAGSDDFCHVRAKKAPKDDLISA